MTKWCFNYESGEYEYIDKEIKYNKLRKLKKV